MTPLERLQAAIARLHATSLTYPDPWETCTHPEWPHVDVTRVRAGDTEMATVYGGGSLERAETIAGMQRRIEAEIEVLAYGAVLVGPIPESILNLADAILGEAS